MRKILSVIKREYIQTVRTKGFIIGTILGPVLMVAIIGVPVLVSLISVGDQQKIGVVDLTQEIFVELDKKLDHRLNDGRRRYILEKIKLSSDIQEEELAELRSSMRNEVLNNNLTAYLFIPGNILEGESAEYVSEHTTDFDELRRIDEALNSVIIEKRLKEEGLDPQKIAKYIKRVGLKPIKLTKRGEEEDTGGTFMYSYIFALILYMALILYGAATMRGVLEEKTSRVVEVILSSLKPFQLMAGKILGIGAVGLTQFSIWGFFGIFAFRYGKSLIPSGEEFNIPRIPGYIFIYFIVFFLLGYFLYSTFFAAIGSMVNSEKEAQQLQIPVVMSLVLPMLLMIFIIRSPNSTLAVVLSLIPLFTPILMFLRVCVLLPPFVQVGASIVILALTVLLMMWLTSKIYRVGILMYGKRPNIKEIVKWIRYK